MVELVIRLLVVYCVVMLASPGYSINNFLLTVFRFEEFVVASALLPYCSLTRQGNWRNLMVRSSRGRGADEQEPELMLVAVVDPQNLSENTVQQLTTDLTTFFRSAVIKSTNIPIQDKGGCY